MDRPFQGDGSSQAQAPVPRGMQRGGSACGGSDRGGMDLQPATARTGGAGSRDGDTAREQAAWTTWTLATLVTACAILASVLLPQ